MSVEQITVGRPLLVSATPRVQDVTLRPSSRFVTINNDAKADQILRRAPQMLTVQSKRQHIAQRVTERQLIGAGQAGPRGESGASAAGVAPIAFSYGDASSAIFTPSVAGTFTLVRLSITTAFDGANPSLKLGAFGQVESILAATQNDPTTAAEYENTPDLHVVANTSVLLTISPGAGATQGAGNVYLVFVPD